MTVNKVALSCDPSIGDDSISLAPSEATKTIVSTMNVKPVVSTMIVKRVALSCDPSIGDDSIPQAPSEAAKQVVSTMIVNKVVSTMIGESCFDVECKRLFRR